MEKKKIKLWKKILMILLVIVIIFAIIFIRRATILADIDKKVTECENNNKNFYVKSTYETSKYTMEINRYIKDNVDKLVIEKTNIDGNKAKITAITYPEERKVFTEAGDNKVMNVYKEKAAIRGAHMENTTETSYTIFSNPAYSMSVIERIINAIGTRIKSVKVDNKDCYELSSLTNTNFLYDDNTTKMLVYVEKDTGLTLKIIQEIKENNEKEQETKKFEYKFNQVTDEDVKEPDNSEYKLQFNV